MTMITLAVAREPHTIYHFHRSHDDEAHDDSYINDDDGLVGELYCEAFQTWASGKYLV